MERKFNLITLLPPANTGIEEEEEEEVRQNGMVRVIKGD